MRRSLIGVALCAMLVIVLFTRDNRSSDPLVEHQVFAMGTVVTVTVLKPDQLSKQQIDDAIRDVEQALQAVDRDWKPWGDGVFGQANELLQVGQPATLPIGMFKDVQQALDLHRSSGGLFDPGIGRLIELWGFHDETRFPSSPPSASMLQELLLQRQSATMLTLGSEQTLIPAIAIRLDFGAFAKGLALNQAIEILTGAGIQSAIVNAGGDLKAIGQRLERPWRIGIRHPRGGESAPQVLAALEIRGEESVVTSGDYERFFMMGERRFHHILDPRSGFPATNARSVTVVHADAALADAASTALFIATSDEWPTIARAMGVDKVMRVNSDGQIHITEALASRIELRVEQQPVIVSLP